MKKNQKDKQSSASHHPMVSVNGSEPKRAILPESLKIYLVYFSEARCRKWIIEELHPNGVFCPSCGELQRSSRIITMVYDLKKIRCRECGRKFSAFSGTVFENCRMSPRQVVSMLMLLGLGRKDAEISRMARISSATVGRWRRLLRAYGSKLV